MAGWKRKSRTTKSEASISREEALARMGQMFGSQFGSLVPTPQPTAPAPAPETDEEHPFDSADEEYNYWHGISEDEGVELDDDDEEEGIEKPPRKTMVEELTHTDAYATTKPNALDKRASRAWLSSRPPISLSASASTSSSSTNKKAKSTTTAEEDAPSLLKNDLELQRLLAESHLFKSTRSGTDSVVETEHAGRNRHLATDLRLSALGSKTSIYKQAKMPMAHRKGIHAAAAGREQKRRREARENGVILERASGSTMANSSGTGKGKTRRAGGGKGKGAIDAPAVGRMNGGLLTLSKRDFADIQGPGNRGGSNSGGGGGFGKKRRR
ncbi:hypothetical protein F4777DRAFT_585715 [Nemania sp. FL0916]|nr:hypothetical protein F4777DRAFT_585715 [Nemania sp. FL0916]